MLNGIYPIIIFNFKKLTPTVVSALDGVPYVADVLNFIGGPPIPLYLDESLTGLMLDSEDKNVDIETTVETLMGGTSPQIHQKAINSTVSVNMHAKRNATGLILLSAFCDMIIPKVTSQEYSISYLSRETTIFGGLLHSFKVSTTRDNDLVQISFEIQKANQLEVKAGPGALENAPGTESLAGGAVANAPTKAIPLGAGPTTPPPTKPPPMAIGGPT